MRGTGEQVVIDGPCLSACTLVVGMHPAGHAAGREGGDMIAVPAGVTVLAAAKPVDFRKGGDRLAAITPDVRSRR
jgi:hypothetical protein